MTADAVGWVGTALFAIGGVTVAYKWRPAFIFLTSGNIAYAVVGLMMALPSLVVISSLMALIDVFAWVKWGKK